MFFIGPRSIFCSQWYPLYQTWDGSVLPMGFKVRVDSSSPALFCHLCIMFPRVISGWLDQESNPDHSLLRRTWYHCACLTRLMMEIKVQNITFWYLRLINFVSVLKPCWSYHTEMGLQFTNSRLFRFTNVATSIISLSFMVTVVQVQ